MEPDGVTCYACGKIVTDDIIRVYFSDPDRECVMIRTEKDGVITYSGSNYRDHCVSCARKMGGYLYEL